MSSGPSWAGESVGSFSRDFLGDSDDFKTDFEGDDADDVCSSTIGENSKGLIGDLAGDLFASGGYSSMTLLGVAVIVKGFNGEWRFRGELSFGNGCLIGDDSFFEITAGAAGISSLISDKSWAIVTRLLNLRTRRLLTSFLGDIVAGGAASASRLAACGVSGTLKIMGGCSSDFALKGWLFVVSVVWISRRALSRFRSIFCGLSCCRISVSEVGNSALAASTRSARQLSAIAPYFSTEYLDLLPS
jgi:hypothetical protein